MESPVGSIPVSEIVVKLLIGYVVASVAASGEDLSK
jgi:hypothetical protein